MTGSSSDDFSQSKQHSDHFGKSRLDHAQVTLFCGARREANGKLVTSSFLLPLVMPLATSSFLLLEAMHLSLVASYTSLS